VGRERRQAFSLFATARTGKPRLAAPVASVHLDYFRVLDFTHTQQQGPRDSTFKTDLQAPRLRREPRLAAPLASVKLNDCHVLNFTHT